MNTQNIATKTSQSKSSFSHAKVKLSPYSEVYVMLGQVVLFLNSSSCPVKVKVRYIWPSQVNVVIVK